MFDRLSATLATALYGRRRDRIRAVWRILVPLVAGFLALNVAGGVAASLGLSRPAAMLAAFGGTAVASVGILFVSARYIDQRPASEYGYEFARSRVVDFAVGTALGGLVVAGAFLLARSSGSLRVVDAAPFEGRVPILSLLAFFVAFVAVAAYEEFLYRGLFVTNAVEGLSARGLSKSEATGVALVASTVAFALIHLPSAIAQGADVGLVAAKSGTLGALLGTAYVLTDDLALPTGLHLGVNFALMNVFGIGSAGVEGFPTLLVVEHAATGLWSPAHGIPILAATVAGFPPVVAWAAWRRDRSGERQSPHSRGATSE